MSARRCRTSFGGRWIGQPPREPKLGDVRAADLPDAVAVEDVAEAVEQRLALAGRERPDEADRGEVRELAVPVCDVDEGDPAVLGRREAAVLLQRGGPAIGVEVRVVG